ncbi:MAG: BrnT family toxin [Devosia sp.]
MELEWNEEKRRKTLEERGLDFADVGRFDTESIQTFEDLRSNYGEARFNTYGYLDGMLCTFCWTRRNERIRIISMRKANDRERKSYQANQNARKP